MTPEADAVIRACAAASLAGTMTFPQVLNQLNQIGVERYHADYTRHETTYYFQDGQSLVVAVEHPEQSIAENFSAGDVEAAVRASQRGEIKYPAFLRRTMQAGCVGYFVQLTGRRVLYFGRTGELHLEHFPAVSP